MSNEYTHYLIEDALLPATPITINVELIKAGNLDRLYNVFNAAVDKRPIGSYNQMTQKLKFIKWCASDSVHWHSEALSVKKVNAVFS